MQKINQLYQEINNNIHCMVTDSSLWNLLQYQVHELYSRYRKQIRSLLGQNRDYKAVNESNQKRIKKLKSQLKQWQPLSDYLISKNIKIYDFVENLLENIKKSETTKFSNLDNKKNI